LISFSGVFTPSSSASLRAINTVAVMKLVAHRAKDMQDFHWLVTHPGFDTQRAEALVREHLGPYVVGEFHSEVRTAKWEQQHSQPIRRPPMRPRGKR
jgi:hypothetical protein